MFLLLQSLFCLTTLKDWINQNKTPLNSINELKILGFLEELYLLINNLQLSELTSELEELLTDYYLVCTQKKLSLSFDFTGLQQKYTSFTKKIEDSKESIYLREIIHPNSVYQYVSMELSNLHCKSMKYKLRLDRFFSRKRKLDSSFIKEFLELSNSLELSAKVHLFLLNCASSNLIKIKSKLISSLSDRSRLKHFQREVVKVLNKCARKFRRDLADYREERYELFCDFEVDAIKLESEIKKCEKISSRCFGFFYPIACINAELIRLRLESQLKELRSKLFVKGKEFHERMVVLNLIYKGFSYFMINTKLFNRIRSRLEGKARMYQEFMNIGLNCSIYMTKEKDLSVFDEYSKVFFVSFIRKDVLIIYSCCYCAALLIILYFYNPRRLLKNKK